MCVCFNYMYVLYLCKLKQMTSWFFTVLLSVPLSNFNDMLFYLQWLIWFVCWTPSSLNWRAHYISHKLPHQDLELQDIWARGITGPKRPVITVYWAPTGRFQLNFTSLAFKKHRVVIVICDTMLPEVKIPKYAMLNRWPGTNARETELFEVVQVQARPENRFQGVGVNCLNSIRSYLSRNAQGNASGYFFPAYPARLFGTLVRSAGTRWGFYKYNILFKFIHEIVQGIDHTGCRVCVQRSLENRVHPCFLKKRLCYGMFTV